MEDYTLLDAAITRLSEGRNSTATLARMVQDQDHAAAPNRIVMAWQQANRDRNEARRSGNEYGGPKPEAFMLSFVQKLQNQVCWSVGSVKAAQVDEDLTNQIYGLDFSQDIHDREFRADCGRHLQRTVDGSDVPRYADGLHRQLRSHSLLRATDAERGR